MQTGHEAAAAQHGEGTTRRRSAATATQPVDGRERQRGGRLRRHKMATTKCGGDRVGQRHSGARSSGVGMRHDDGGAGERRRVIGAMKPLNWLRTWPLCSAAESDSGCAQWQPSRRRRGCNETRRRRGARRCAAKLSIETPTQLGGACSDGVRWRAMACKEVTGHRRCYRG